MLRWALAIVFALDALLLVVVLVVKPLNRTGAGPITRSAAVPMSRS